MSLILFFIIRASFDICDNIFDGDFGFEQMCGANEQPAFFACDIEIFKNCSTYILGSSERHNGLSAECSVERKTVTELFVKLSEIHCFGLNGIKNINTCFNERGNKFCYTSARMIEHNDIRWITPDEIPLYEFCPADEEILEKIISKYR